MQYETVQTRCRVEVSHTLSTYVSTPTYYHYHIEHVHIHFGFTNQAIQIRDLASSYHVAHNAENQTPHHTLFVICS